MVAAFTPGGRANRVALSRGNGTLSLPSIPGWRASLSNEEMLAVLQDCGAVICAAGAGLAPADKKLYALRDVTATVEAIPLIASSIMSKKIAEGTGALILDVKTGVGAFMSDPELVLLDEPCAGVNPSLVGGISRLLKELNLKSGGSFVVIEHNMDFVMDLCHRIMVMVEGTVLAIGTPDEIRSNKQVLDAYLGN
jgi:hypothetical protein